MTKQTKEMLSALTSGIDLTKPNVRSIRGDTTLECTLSEIRTTKADIVNLINILLEEN